MKTQAVPVPLFALVGILAVVGSLAVVSADGKKDGDEANTPLKIVRVNTEKVLDILRDPELKKEENQEKQREKVRQVARGLFDWDAIGKRVLGRHWWDRSEKQKEEFLELFRRLLEKTYLDRIRKNAEADIKYQGQEVDSEDGYASVNVLAVAKDDTEVPIIYRMKKLSSTEKDAKKTDLGWLVYDVKVEGVSLVGNYRSQFNDIIIGSGYQRLIKKLRAKVEQQD